MLDGLVADQVGVMYRGRIVERGPVGRVFADPQAEYTRSLLDASPGLGEERTFEGGLG